MPLNVYGALECILNIGNLTGRLARGRLHLSEFHFDVLRREGVKNHAADAPSELETEGADKKLIEEDITELVMSLVHLTDPIPRNSAAVRLTNTVCLKVVTSPLENCRKL